MKFSDKLFLLKAGASFEDLRKLEAEEKAELEAEGAPADKKDEGTPETKKEESAKDLPADEKKLPEAPAEPESKINYKELYEQSQKALKEAQEHINKTNHSGELPKEETLEDLIKQII